VPHPLFGRPAHQCYARVVWQEAAKLLADAVSVDQEDQTRAEPLQAMVQRSFIGGLHATLRQVEGASAVQLRWLRRFPGWRARCQQMLQETQPFIVHVGVGDGD
jgi:hypothetical protein